MPVRLDSLPQAPIRLSDIPDNSDLFSSLLRHDEAFDYSGVKDFRFRAALSRRDSDAERKVFLDKTVGGDGYTNDNFGRLALTPEGLARLGLKSPSGKPVVVDESLPSKYDIADISGSAPAIAGGMALATAAGPIGWGPGIALAALGAAGGKGFGESVEALKGENIQGPGEVAKDLATEGALSAAGEGIFRGVLAPIGKKLLAPQAKRVAPDALKIADEARQLGARPNISQITKAPILGRVQNMLHMVVGDPAAKQNQAALHTELSRLAGVAGQPSKRIDVGSAAVKDITRARSALSRWAGIAYGKVDDLTGGKAVVPTSRLKDQAVAVLKELPPNTEGAPILTDPQTVTYLRQIAELPDSLTVGQTQAIRGRLHDAVSDKTLAPGLASRHARLLEGAAKDGMEDIADPQTKALLKRVNAVYGREIKKFDDALISRITRDPRYAGSIPPEQFVDAIFKKNQASTLSRVMPLLKKGTQNQVRQQAMEKILGTVIQTTDDPVLKIFDGAALQKTLDSYGADSLEAMFGKQISDDLYKFARTTRFISQGMGKSGQIVAAGIALHPFGNIGKLLGINLMAKFLNTDGAVKWLTVGLSAPKTRAGASALARATTLAQVLAKDEANKPVEAANGR